MSATPLARTGRLLTNTGAWDISVDPAVPIADEALCPQVCPWWFESGWYSGSDETIVDPMGPPGSVPGDYTVFELVSVEPTGVVLADVPPAGPGAVNDAQGLYAAASFGTLPVYDLTTGELVFQTDDLAGDGLFPSALAFMPAARYGIVTVTDAPGLGVEIDTDLLKHLSDASTT